MKTFKHLRHSSKLKQILAQVMSDLAYAGA